MSNTIQKRSVGRHFSRNYPVAPPQATQRTKRSKTQRKLLNFGLSRRRSICLPAQKSWKLRSRERALPCLHSPTRHWRLAQTSFCAGKPKRKPPKVASFKWPPGNRRFAREQADSDRHLEKHYPRCGLNRRRFPLKQIRARRPPLQISRRRSSNFFIRGTSSVTNSSGFLVSSSASVCLSLVRQMSQVRV